ncbi:hypothetical protein AC579_1968 [Pseudocercospora musae]|uniref:RBR-type E3 ubiquitin transferase n=1 Tax=Pseudocercospora musae TaxID=113226 RepID=A0A139I8D6_9PEZI|nr:hypothetical protein AC579_1968 [Pseudocercospora musae]
MDKLTKLFAGFLYAQPQPIECGACFDECRGKNVQLAGDHLCYDCFETGYVSQFHEALKDESKFPVKYGTTVLEPRDYLKHFDGSFRAAWREKKVEYNTPVKLRLYCNSNVDNKTAPTDQHSRDGSPITTQNRCGEFLGSSSHHISAVTCKSCKGRTCTRCSQPYSSSDHACPAAEGEEDAFAGLERGVDFQICPIPTCQVKMSLRDGCNGASCVICHTDFCFICGEESQPGHWDAGKPCPRFGRKGSQRAIFDTPAPDDRIARQFERWIAVIDRLLPPVQLWETDLETLRTLHTRVEGIRGGGRTVRRIHRLIHELESGIGIYWRGGQARASRIEENSRIRALVAKIGDQGFADWPLLRQVVDSYELAWAGRLEELMQVAR